MRVSLNLYRYLCGLILTQIEYFILNHIHCDLHSLNIFFLLATAPYIFLSLDIEFFWENRVILIFLLYITLIFSCLWFSSDLKEQLLNNKNIFTILSMDIRLRT